MSKIGVLALLSCLTTLAALAQHNTDSHQNKNDNKKADSLMTTATNDSTPQQLVQLLSLYYNIKNALVAGNANSASANAGLFVSTVNAMDPKVGSVQVLAEIAGKIAGSMELKKQRNFFIDLSLNMANLAKSVKPGNQPIYLQYCPMKNASWLSSERLIKNPYYGSSMLTCGEIMETITPKP